MPTISLSEIQQFVWDRLENNQVLYTSAQLTAAINESYRIINAACGINQSTISVPGFSVANQLIYSTPSPILFPLQAYFEGRRMNKLSLGALARKHLGWATDSSIKAGPPQRWAPIGITQFVIHPYDSLGGRDIAVTGVVEPTLLVNPGDILSVEDEFIEMTVELSAHRLQLLEGGRVFADSSSTMLPSFYRRLKRRTMFTAFRAPKYWVLSGPVQ